jgi:transglutaminase-like putative cysteine protease
MAAAICALISVPLVTYAAEQPLRIEREFVRYEINQDGSYAESRETAIKVLKDTALSAAKSASVSYSTSIQKAEVVAAYTLKADGRRIPVPQGNYQLNTSSGRDGDSPFYSDETTLSVVFPDLAVGDTTVFAYRLVANQPMFDGHFSVIESFNPATYYGDVRITIDAPASLQAQHQSWQMEEGAPRGAAARKVVEWRWRNRKPVDPATLRDSVYNPERYPGYAWSTFTDYAQIARAYGERAAAKAIPTPRVRALADEVAGDAKEPRDVAKRLYEWVSRNISYAGNCIGLGAVVPRDLDVVLDNRMGDCKDHATLLEALLAARGIESTQALINAGSSYALPRVPVASVVNHVINYLPGFDLYVDSTAATAPFDTLPAQLADKPVLLVNGHRDDARTPKRRRGNDWQKLWTSLSIRPDGSVKGRQKLELNGRLAVAAREQFRDMAPDDEAKLVKRYFRGAALRANGSVRHDDPAPMLEHFVLEADFEVERAIPPSGGFALTPWFVSYAPLQAVVLRNTGDEEQPAGESNCGGILSEEEYELEFPTGVDIVAMPSDVSVEQGEVTYSAIHRREGQRLHAKRSLDDRTPGPVCSAEYNADYARTMRQLLPALRQQVVYVDRGINTPAAGSP